MRIRRRGVPSSIAFLALAFAPPLAAQSALRVGDGRMVAVATLAEGVEPAAAVVRLIRSFRSGDRSEVSVVLPTDASDEEARAYVRVARRAFARIAAEDDIRNRCAEPRCDYLGGRMILFTGVEVRGRSATVEFVFVGSPPYRAELLQSSGGTWKVTCLAGESRPHC